MHLGSKRSFTSADDLADWLAGTRPQKVSLSSANHRASIHALARAEKTAGSWTSTDGCLANLQRAFHASRSQLAKNPYTVLGVGKDASTSEIKKNYYQVR